MSATYETFAVLDALIEADHLLVGQNPRRLAKWLKTEFSKVIRITLPQLNLKRVQWLGLAVCLSVDGDAEILDFACEVTA